MFVEDVGHRTGGIKSLNPKKIKNFVKCDAQHLPFKDECFELVYSSNVIEHVLDPILMLDEMVRVSGDFVTIVAPHWLGDKLRKKNPFHIQYFRSSWFRAYGLSRGLYLEKDSRQIKRSKIDYLLNLFGIQNEIVCRYRK